MENTEAVLANFAVISGIIVAIIKLLEIFLSDPQKTKLGHASIKIWILINFVSPAKLLTIISNNHYSMRVYLFMLMLALGSIPLGILIVVYMSSTDEPNSLLDNLVPISVLGGFTLTGLLGWRFRAPGSRLIQWFGSNGNVLAFIAKSLGILVVVYLIMWAADLIVHFNREFLNSIYAFFRNNNENLYFIFAFTIYNIALFPATSVIISLILFVLFVYLFIPAYYLYLVFEFIVRRIAEHDKGPIIALSVLLASVGAIVKVFSDR